jgi:uncharacterized RDD family membrane protein YckC
VTCPACRAAFGPGQEQCPACGAVVAPRVEGALAPKAEPLREIPALKKKEKTWKDEVRDRVRTRKRQKGGVDQELPLFRDAEGAEEAADAEPPASPPAPPPDPESSDPYAVTERMARPSETLDDDEPMADLPLRPLEDRPSHAPLNAAPVRLFEEPPARERVFELDAPEAFESEPAPAWPSEIRVPADDARPVERPARFVERLQAGAVDLALLGALWSIVVYFASRAARVPVEGLLPAWPSLLGYLAFLGLMYASYFTGTTGQTLGKIVGGLRVVDTAGRPPGYFRALLRAAFAVPGILIACVGVAPMFFDPARRALHDRLLRTRVVKG